MSISSPGASERFDQPARDRWLGLIPSNAQRLPASSLTYRKVCGLVHIHRSTVTFFISVDEPHSNIAVEWWATTGMATMAAPEAAAIARRRKVLLDIIPPLRPFR